MRETTSSCRGHRFLVEIISHVVWPQKFKAENARRLKKKEQRPNGNWHPSAMFVRLNREQISSELERTQTQLSEVEKNPLVALTRQMEKSMPTGWGRVRISPAGGPLRRPCFTPTANRIAYTRGT